MINKKMIGAILLAVGIGLAIWGYQTSGSVNSQLTKAFSGSPTDKVMMMYIGGTVAIIAGIFMLLKR